MEKNHVTTSNDVLFRMPSRKVILGVETALISESCGKFLNVPALSIVITYAISSVRTKSVARARRPCVPRRVAEGVLLDGIVHGCNTVAAPVVA